jgi:hypothetical protein
MNERTIETARDALYEIRMYIDSYTASDELQDALAAWRKLKNFIDLAEKEIAKA